MDHSHAHAHYSPGRRYVRPRDDRTLDPAFDAYRDVDLRSRRAARAGSSSVNAGITAGIAGGVLMALAAQAIAWMIGQSIWEPLQLVAALYFGPDAVGAGTLPIVLGASTHLAVAAFWGMVFGAIVRRSGNVGSSLLSAFAFGAVVWGFMTYLVIPWANTTLYATVMQMQLYWLALHLVFALGLALSPALARRLYARRAARSYEAPHAPGAPHWRR
jgi:hypothetical protein